MDGAHTVPLPTSPPEVNAEDTEGNKDGSKDGVARKKSVMSYFSLAQAKFKKATEKDLLQLLIPQM